MTIRSLFFFYALCIGRLLCASHLCLALFSVLHFAFVFLSSLSSFSLPLLLLLSFFFVAFLFISRSFFSIELGFSFCFGLFTFPPTVQHTTDRIGNRVLMVGARAVNVKNTHTHTHTHAYVLFSNIKFTALLGESQNSRKKIALPRFELMYFGHPTV